MTDDQFIGAFEDCTLSNEEFHHADHVRTGFLYMCRFPGLEGIRRFSEGLERFAAAKGKPSLYHETITWAFLLLIRERVARWCEHKGRPPNWVDFSADNVDLLNWKDHILKSYYLEETLRSELARKTFVLPDRNVSHLTKTKGEEE